ncbi:MAG: ABC transporter permease, partial [Bacteroidota bacterium]
MLLKIAWKNIIHKPLSTALCISLLLFGVGIISLLLLIQYQLEQKFERDLQNIDLVVGAKGSPLQLVLSAIYHLDAPTGNIKLAEARTIMENPLVGEAIPLAYGDSYRGYRILGTTTDYLEKYDAQLAEGRTFSKAMEVTVGADIAAKVGLQVGSTFLGTHGEVQEGHEHEDHPYTVVGILQKTNTVLDRLLITNVESVWQVHAGEEEHDHDEDHNHEDGHDHDEGHDHEDGHDHEEEHDHEDHVATDDSMDITAVLLKYKTRLSVMNMPRIINEQTNMQAVLPGVEINRLFYMLGVGATTLRLIAGGIMLMAGFSVFFVLY